MTFTMWAQMNMLLLITLAVLLLANLNNYTINWFKNSCFIYWAYTRLIRLLVLEQCMQRQTGHHTQISYLTKRGGSRNEFSHSLVHLPSSRACCQNRLQQLAHVGSHFSQLLCILIKSTLTCGKLKEGWTLRTNPLEHRATRSNAQS